MSSTRTVHMHVEGVPNPRAMKFVLENGILADKSYEFTNLSDSKESPLARRLLMLRYVERIMINQNYVTVMKVKDAPEWDNVLFEIRMLIQNHLEQNEPIMHFGVKELKHNRTDMEILELVERLLDQHIRPAAQEDGGDLFVKSYANGILDISMHGSCFSCPHANTTLKDGIEPLITQFIPEVQKVTCRDNQLL